MAEKISRAERIETARRLVTSLIGTIPSASIKKQVCKQTGHTKAAVGDMIKQARKKAGIYTKKTKFIVETESEK